MRRLWAGRLALFQLQIGACEALENFVSNVACRLLFEMSHTLLVCQCVNGHQEFELHCGRALGEQHGEVDVEGFVYAVAIYFEVGVRQGKIVPEFQRKGFELSIHGGLAQDDRILGKVRRTQRYWRGGQQCGDQEKSPKTLVSCLGGTNR